MRQHAVVAPAQRQSPAGKQQCQPEYAAPDRQVGLADQYIDGNQRQAEQRRQQQAGQQVSAGAAGAQRAEEQAARHNAQQPEHGNRQDLLSQLGRIGHTDAQTAQDVDHHIQAEGHQRAGQHPCEPVEQGKGNKRQARPLLSQGEQPEQWCS